MKSIPDTADDALKSVSDQIDLKVEEIRASVERVLSAPLYWFPVRHHSPSVARFLQRAIEKRKPKMLFIEGPSEANDLVKHVVDSATKPPIAIYTSYRDDNNVLGLAGILSAAPDIPARFASWYPMLSYSPEYVAMTSAKKIGAEVRFIDLPHHALLKPFRPKSLLAKAEADDSDDSSSQPNSDDSDDSSNQPRATSQSAPDSSSEKLMEESSFFQTLAEVAGYRTFNEAWDSFFEIRNFDNDVELFRRELATFCAASRATSRKRRVADDGTLERERHMLKTINETMQSENLKPEDCMVICGGFHLFLDPDDKIPPPECPAGTIYTTVVPYSFFRFSEMSGYGAGNRAPQFYQTLWEMRKNDQPENLLIQHVVNTLTEARRTGEPLSSADAISTCQHAEMLARLRGRPQPILDDIHDALITCCCKGDPADVGVHLLKAMAAVDIGTKIGRVTEALGQLPIVNDFYKQMEFLELEECLSREQSIRVKVDKREEKQRRQSVFLHRMSWLNVGLAAILESGSATSGTIFLETWGLKWSPRVEDKLIETNLYGDTIESAALASFRETMAESSGRADHVSTLILSALNMEFPNIVNEVEAILSEAIDNDTHFASLATALANLIMFEQYGLYRGMRKDIVAELIERCFDRACFSIVDTIAVPEEQQKDVVTGLLTLAEIVQRGDRADLDRNLFVQHLSKAATTSDVPFMRGVFLGLLTELRIKTTDDLAHELSALAKASVEIMVTAGDFLDGIMAVSRTSIMLGATSLIAAIDELLRAADWDSFLTMVPKMRAAFERLHLSQRDSIADQVAKKYGLKDSESLTEIRTTLEGATMIVDLDNRVAQIMSKWDF